MTGPCIIAVIAVCGTTISGILHTVFHSRCKTIKCCGAECNRDVIHTKEEVNLNENNEN
tara:strand:+ start:15 stop:191 length:177 start_codon:yes stop_codon:yes gene_type:complete